MKRINGKGVLAAVFTLLAYYSPLTMATVVYNVGPDEKVTSVTGIEIDGYSGTYKVEFIDGTITDLFTGEHQPFYWNGYEGGSADDFVTMATSVLGERVFAATGDGYTYDWPTDVDGRPWLVRGLSETEDVDQWEILTPYDIYVGYTDNEGWVPPAAVNQTFINSVIEANDRYVWQYSALDYDTGGSPRYVYAVWSVEETGVVPEPTTVALLAVGALGMSLSGRKRRKENR